MEVVGGKATWGFTSRVILWPVASGLTIAFCPTPIGSFFLYLLSSCVPVLVLMQAVWVLALSTAVSKTCMAYVDEYSRRVYVTGLVWHD